MQNYDSQVKRLEIEEKEEWSKWNDEIPFLNFGEGYSVKNIPPLTGAIVRFLVKKTRGKKFISVYLDCYDRLGAMGVPYWEIYPAKGGYNERFLLQNTKQLVNAIKKSLNSNK